MIGIAGIEETLKYHLLTRGSNIEHVGNSFLCMCLFFCFVFAWFLHSKQETTEATLCFFLKKQKKQMIFFNGNAVNQITGACIGMGIGLVCCVNTISTIIIDMQWESRLEAYAIHALWAIPLSVCTSYLVFKTQASFFLCVFFNFFSVPTKMNGKKKQKPTDWCRCG